MVLIKTFFFYLIDAIKYCEKLLISYYLFFTLYFDVKSFKGPFQMHRVVYRILMIVFLFFFRMGYYNIYVYTHNFLTEIL